MLNIYSKRTVKLSKQNIQDIFKLKNTHWKYSISEQKKFFQTFIKKKDIHNLMYFKNELIGYTLLRNSKLVINKKKYDYFHFDTLIIKKKFRKLKLSNLQMDLNNSVIKLHKKPSVLFCSDNMVRFYKKKNWTVINKNLSLPYLRGKMKKTLIFNF